VPVKRCTCGCGQLIPARQRFCATGQRADDHRRNQKRQTSGRTTARWNRLRTTAIAIAGNRCHDCDVLLPTARLHGHLDPKLKGDHRAATLADITILCASCHGRRDGARAARAAF